MATITPKKTSMKLQSVSTMLRNSIKFAEHTAVTIAERDYGLIRVTGASGTPHPRLLTGVNMDTLKERLEAEQEKNLRDHRADSELDIETGLRFRSDTDRRSHRKLRLTETPHPNKGINLEPKPIDPHLMKDFKAGHISSPWSTKHQYTDFAGQPLRSSIQSSIASSKSIPIKKSARIETGTKGTKKKVTLIPPKKTITNASSSSSSSLSSDKLKFMSFNERRRIFHEGEFTIAKYGKKMSEQMMPMTSNLVFSGENIDNAAERAKKEIDFFVKSQGFVMNPTGTLTNLRRFSSTIMKRSMPTKRVSGQSSDSADSTKKIKRKSAGSIIKAPV